MTTYNQEYRNESGPKAELNSTIVQFYEQCCKVSGVNRPWHTLHPQVQIRFYEASSIMHSIIFNGQ